MNHSYWNDIENPAFPWIASFNKIIKSAAPPSLNGETILISSDYSGDFSKAKYSVFSILITDLKEIGDWERKRRLIRDAILKNRKMSFKGLNDVFKQKALISFLDAANYINGLCVNIVINKEIRDIIYSEELYRKLCSQEILKQKWHINAFERMAKLVHFISLLIAGMAKPKQNIYWYSDEDNIFSNENFSSDVSTLLGKFCGLYVKCELGECGIGTTKLNEADFFEEDMNAIPDLSAGALSEFFESVCSVTNNNRLKDFTYIYPKNLSTKTLQILDWLAYSEKQLKKITVVFDKLDSGFKIWRFDTDYMRL